MTAEEEFDAYWVGKGYWYSLPGSDIKHPRKGGAYSEAKAAWLASREATAKRCVEICTELSAKMYPHAKAPYDNCIAAIEREFGGKP